MDIVRDTRIDFLGLKWAFVGLSVVLAVASAASIFGGGGLNLGVDFTGGTLVYLKFADSPDNERIRSTLNAAGLRAQEVTRFDEEEANEVQIRMARDSDDMADSASQDPIYEALAREFQPEDFASSKTDLNNTSRSELTARIGEAAATRVVEYRTSQSGLIKSLIELDSLGLDPAATSQLRSGYYTGAFTILSVESVGPKVGSELRERAQNAVLFSLLGMLIYIAFRFRPIYGVAAIVALFHDVFLTLGFFSLTGKELSLTVIAALLTLVGYSINDTIVVFDRVRENLRLMRRSDLYSIINASINQTLNRTILTSGMTFLAVFALYMLGGEALNGFSFALVVGIIVGTYSSVAIASPIVLWWENVAERRKAA